VAAPFGNRNAAKAREWADGIKWVLDNYEAPGIGRGQALRAIAAKVVAAALEGNLAAITEIANRLDGKALQPVEMDATLRNTEISGEPLTPDEWIATYGRPAT
jgi:hypothetical protein